MIGLVQQEPILFNLSIRDNIAYGDNSRDIKQEEIEAAARMANIHELIITFPQVFSISLLDKLNYESFRVMKHYVGQKVVNCLVDKNN